MLCESYKAEGMVCSVVTLNEIPYSRGVSSLCSGQYRCLLLCKFSAQTCIPLLFSELTWMPLKFSLGPKFEV